MLFSKNMLFLHVPKTAGMALAEYFVRTLPRPIYRTDPHPETSTGEPGVTIIPGGRHQTLAEAALVVRSYGFELPDFPVILVVLRNPYDLEVSRYSYYFGLPHWFHPLTEWTAHNWRLARRETFEKFALYAVWGFAPEQKVENYYRLNETPLPNLRFVRFEHLNEELPDILRDVGIEPVGSIPQINVSPRGDWTSYYTRAAEQAVYERFKWIFDNGYYERVDPSTFLFVDRSPFNGEKVRIVGDAHQVGPAATWWPGDGWVGEEFRVRLAFDAPTSRIAIEGWRPEHFKDPLRLELTVGDVGKDATFGPGEFRMEVPIRMPARCEVELALTPSRTWIPAEHGLNDDQRDLSFVLRQIAVNGA